MRRLLLGIFLLTSISAQGSDPDKLARQLDQIAKEYEAIQSKREIGKLVELDARLRHILDEPWKRSKESFDGSNMKPSWSGIGVYVGHYSEALGYSGELLVEAHQIDPHSRYRRSTLFSAITGEGTYHGLGVMPDIQVALEYLKEFPQRPFADEAAIIMGNFYNDLFKVLKNLQQHQPHDYKYDCFSKYVKKTDLSEQAKRAQRLSIHYYSRVLALRARSANEWEETKDVRRYMLEMRKGIPLGWHFCAD